MQLSRGSAFVALTRSGAIAAFGIALASCTAATVDSKYGVRASSRVITTGSIPKGGGTYRVGDPYVIAGKTYVPREDANYRAEGQASWYGSDFQGRVTANGEIFDMNSISAAHPTLPLPCYVRVTNLDNHKSVVVRVNDRGPYHDGRLIDLSVRAAKMLGFYDRGTARVRVEWVGRASLNGSDDNKLAETLRTDEPTTPLVRVASAASVPPISPAIAAPKTQPSIVTAYVPQPEHPALQIGRGLY
jgi:rare lipoprotein A